MLLDGGGAHGSTKREASGLKYEANAEVPETCILLKIQQGATLLVAKRSPAPLEIMGKCFSFSAE